MTYWHMQLHPSNQGFNKEKEILERKQVIGLGQWEAKGAKSQINQFKNKMKIGDIVLIKNGATPIALVEVTGEAEYSDNVNKDLDWFRNRRKVKVLDILKEEKHDFPQPRGTLQKSINRYTPTYQYINNWYNKLTNPKLNNTGIKLRSIYIESFRMFKDFKIDFTDKNNKICPIIILAGINGSGKTTLLEYIKNYDTSPKYDSTDHINIYINGSNTTIYKNSKKKQTDGINELKKSVVYLPISINKTKGLDEKIKEYINELIFENNYNASTAYKELQDNINEIFGSIKLEIKFSGLNKNKEIFFTNNSGNIFSIDDLSTGEKTLLTKVLYLYLNEVKNKVILIDEPEISLHPNWQNSILQLYETFSQKNNNQIIIATHSPHIISGAKSNYIRILELSDSKVTVIDDYSQSYGLEVNKVLTDIMGTTSLRTPPVEDQIKKIKQAILNNDSENFDRLINRLEADIGKKDVDIKMLKFEMNMRNNNA